MSEKSLYERLGGIYSIAAVTDHFIDSLADDPLVGTNTSNAYLKDWYENKNWRSPGFKVLNTIWVCEKAGGREKYVSTVINYDSFVLDKMHFDLYVNADEFVVSCVYIEILLTHID